jgi:enoyl-CoA hydratase
VAATTIQIDSKDGAGIITLHRPDALNAISTAMLREIAEAIDGFDADPSIACVVITGSAKAFAAGADIREMATLSAAEAARLDLLAEIDRIAAARKPLIAAVAGYALGGGCELALACDIVLAADTARFGLPELSLGIVPGMGGTQRLTRLVGKARAMDLILTGRVVDAAEAERIGLASRVVRADALLEEAMAIARRIAEQSANAVVAAKEAVLRSFDLPLSEGLRAERQAFHALFGSPDQAEGMAAFLAKRKAQFRRD